MTVYADWTYYANSYLGTVIAESDFPALALRASAVIDQITFARAAVDFAANTNVAAIKNATCAIAEELQRQKQSANADGIQSESQGQYSVSYAIGSNRLKSNQARLETAARVWLANTFLIFAGFNTGEYSGTPDDP